MNMSASDPEADTQARQRIAIQRQSSNMSDNVALALLRWNHLNPPSRMEAWITIGILVGGAIWAFWPVVIKWWRDRG